MKTVPPVTIPFKNEGRTVLLLGGLGSTDATRFGGTQYAKVVLNTMWGMPPELDLDYEKRVQAAIREVVQSGHAESSHDVGEGGLAVALAESCVLGMGVQASLHSDLRPEFALFHEGPSRVLVSTSVPEEIAKIAEKHGVASLRLGDTMKGRLRVDCNSTTILDVAVDEIREIWEHALEDKLALAHA
jgi:phosphoribosylformylglycinamidine synthase